MREWKLKSGDPLSLTLAADARLGATNYGDDQIWELSMGGGDPPALAIQTTYGLRARICRLFPRFIENDKVQVDPASFDRAPALICLYPNYLSVSYAPFPDIDVIADYWVPQSQSLAGRLEITNKGKTARKIRLEWIAQLNPTEGQRMGAAEIEAASVLLGQSEKLYPVVFATGGVQAGTESYPSLTNLYDLNPGASQTFNWTQAAWSTPETSFSHARSLAGRKWEAERTRLDFINTSLLDIYTGDTDLDAVLMLSQRQAMSLFIGPTQQLPFPSIVSSRQPNQGFSFRGDGSDFNYLWNGQSPPDIYYLTGLALPGAYNLLKGLLDNYLAVQMPDGFIDWKPGLCGQRSQVVATPLLASLARRLYEINPDPAYLSTIIPPIFNFLKSWFSPVHDRDGDGLPEWDHPMQAGCEDHPIYSRWGAGSLGLDISSVESVALCSFLYRECIDLLHLAGLLYPTQSNVLTETITSLQPLANHLRETVESMWDDSDASYHDWDRDTHTSPAGEKLGERMGSGTISVRKKFDRQVRLFLSIQTSDEITRRPRLTFQSVDRSGEFHFEQVTEDRFRWYLGYGCLTTERVYSYIDQIEVNGLSPGDLVRLYVADYRFQEISLLLPLWAGIPSQARAQRLVEQSICNPERYWHKYGLPTSPVGQSYPEAIASQNVNLIWNTWITEGMLRYGYRKQAADLYTRLMSGILLNLKRENVFRQYYHADTGQGIGERNHLQGLAPVKLFLDILGIHIFSTKQVAVTGLNPFPWPVTVNYRQLTVLCQKERTSVIFPDGQTLLVTEPLPQLITLTANKN